MTKQDFINKVAGKSGLSNRDAGKAVDAFMEAVTETLKSGDSINFTGCGKFSPAARAARQGVNPRTGERVQIAATTVPFAVMMERGLFKKYGLDIDGFIGSNGGGTTIRNMLANGLPFSEVGTPSVFAAIHEGIELTIVYASTNNMGETSWVVRKDSPIKTIADLRGKLRKGRAHGVRAEVA